MRIQIAEWSSKGGKWTSELIKEEFGYRLEDKKNGSSCGASWRPKNIVNNDEEAIAWASKHVETSYDVKMKRTR